MQGPRPRHFSSVQSDALSTMEAGTAVDSAAITVDSPGEEPDFPSPALLRLMRRRVPPEKRQRTEMSCDWCKKKRCKCLRKSTTETCRACGDCGRTCTTTEPRKRRVYRSLSVVAAAGASSPSSRQQQQQQQHHTSHSHQQRQQQQQQQQQQHRRHTLHDPSAAAAVAAAAASLPPPSPAASSPVLESITVQSPDDLMLHAMYSMPHTAQPNGIRHASYSFPPTSSASSPLPIDPAIDSSRGAADVSMAMTATDPRLLMRNHAGESVATVAPMDVVVSAATLSLPAAPLAGADAVSSAGTPPPPPPSDASAQKPPGDELLFEDPLEPPHYIGPLGSYALLTKLWEAMASNGASAATATNTTSPAATQQRDTEQTMGHHQPMLRRMRSTEHTDAGDAGHDGSSSMGADIELPPRDVADALVALFFDKVHCDFPIFNRALFQAKYESLWPTQHRHQALDTESAWLMCLSMVFVLGLEVASPAQTRALRDQLVAAATVTTNNADSRAALDALRARYLEKAQEALPDVITGSMLVHVQALMLYSRYLHITRNRSACWNLTGVAIRIAVAIGLHRNTLHAKCSPLELELRRRVWWTLFAFERLECSSLGRTSAIDDAECSVGLPHEDILDSGDAQVQPLGYVGAHTELMMLLGTICKHQYSAGPANDEPHKLLDMAAATGAALAQWHTQLPSHLWPQSEPAPSPTHMRAILLLHVQYHYAVTLLCRPFLLALVNSRTSAQTRGSARPSKLTPEMPFPSPSSSPSLSADPTSCPAPDNTHVLYARKCIDSAKVGVAVINQLFCSGLFNSKTGWDVFFIEAFCMPLAMSRFAIDSDRRNDRSILDALKASTVILHECKEFSPTMQRFATATTEFVQALVTVPQQQSQQYGRRHEQRPQQPQPQQYTQHHQVQQQQQQQHHMQQDEYFYPQQQPIPSAVARVVHKVDGLGDQGSWASASSASSGIGSMASAVSRTGSHAGSSHSSGSTDGSYDVHESPMPVIFGHMDAAFNPQPLASTAMHDPFNMPWNMNDMSQVWSGNDWTEPAEQYW